MCNIKKIHSLHSLMRSYKLHNESFHLSYLLAKMASEQLLFEQEDFSRYNCFGCGKPHNSNELTDVPAGPLLEKKIPQRHFAYKQPINNSYKICDNCKNELIKLRECFLCKKDFLANREEDFLSRDELIIHNLDEIAPHAWNILKPIGENEFPVCDECYEEIDEKYSCAVCDIDLNEDSDEIMEVRKSDVHSYELQDKFNYNLNNSNSKYPVCEHCHDHEIMEMCADCHESLMFGEMDAENADGNKVCPDCAGDYRRCESCESIINIENEPYTVANEEIYCEDCAPENENDFMQLERDLNNAVGDSPAEGPSMYIPLNKASLDKILNMLNPIFKKYNKPGARTLSPKVSRNVEAMIDRIKINDDEKEFIKAFLFSPIDEQNILQMVKLRLLINYSEEMNSVLQNITDKYLISSKTKRLKKYRPMSVSFDVIEPRDPAKYNSFVVIMNPTDDMIRASKDIFGLIGPIAFDLMSGIEGWGAVHHDGSIAYARIGNIDGEWVIENLQRDADYQNFLRAFTRSNKYYNETYNSEMHKAAKWWDKQTSNWATQLIFAIMELAKTSGVRLYLTPFYVQKNKWGSIPEKSRDVYDGIPSELAYARKEKVKEQKDDDMELSLSTSLPREEEWSGTLDEQFTEGNNFWRLAELNKNI